MIKGSRKSIQKTIDILEEKIGKKKINFRSKDWGFQDKDIGDVQYRWRTIKMEI